MGCSSSSSKTITPTTDSQPSKMTIDFYYIPGSAPCRSVLMAAKAFNVDLNLKLTNLMAGEHMKPEFLKLNPQHCVPTLDDNGFVLWESRAILGYLADKYGKDDSFYPKDAQKRAQVNQQLYFDMGTLYQRFGDYYYPQIFAKQPANPELFKKMEDAVGFLDTALEGKTYVVGDHLTIADISLVASISTYDIADFDFSKYPNVQRWFEKCKTTIPGYELNQKGVEEFAHYLKDLKK